MNIAVLLSSHHLAETVRRLEQINRITSFDDFNVTYGENTNVGNGSVTITPKADSSYTRRKLTQKFVIYKKSITGATVSASSVTYTGGHRLLR